MSTSEHLELDCGIELGVVSMPGTHAVAMEFRMLTGAADEPADKLGLARLIKETVDKGTEQRDGRALFDALDELGASTGAWTGREATGFGCVCLPEFFDRAVELHAEFLRTPTFPEDAVRAAVTLTEQEIGALEDDPPSLADKYIGRQGFGPVLGRHPLGERETVVNIVRDDLVEHWRHKFCAGRMQAVVTGPVDPGRVAQTVERHFTGFGSKQRMGRQGFGFEFQPRVNHYPKDIEQEQIAICFRSAAVTDDDFSAERLLLGVLAGGMSSRLFTEVREKQGLAYDVHASSENPRGLGMIFVSASCKPARAEQTFRTLLGEIERLSEDLTDQEVERARTRIVSREETLADMTRSRRNAVARDLFHFGRPRSVEERLEGIRAVRTEDIAAYLRTHSRDRLSIVTLGPKELSID